MAFFRVKIGKGDDAKIYELDKLTLGEARTLKRHFGLEDVTEFNSGDPDIIAGLLYLAVKREKPEATHSEISAEVDALDVEEFEEAPDPTPPPAKPSKAKVKAGA